MATIAYLQLDSSYDPIFNPTQSLANAAAVQQAILTRLKLFYGEWWEDLSLGLPVFQSMLGQLGTTRGQAAMRLAIQQNIEGGPYIISVAGIVTSFTNGQFAFTATVNTAFGRVTVSNLPAAQASLGS